ncbi:MAG TPA: hypothetical protein VFY12_10710 [Arenimonas sp.]|nr:hypothetical protein [Arenimonas sp.]
MSRRGLLLLAMLALAACGKSEPPAAPASDNAAAPPAAADIAATVEAAPTVAPLGSYRPLELQLGSELDVEGRVREARTTFAPDARVHLSVLGSAGDLPVRVKARWLDADDQLLGESGQLLEPGPASVLTFTLTQPQGWPPGRYRVELALNDLEVDQREFEVR